MNSVNEIWQKATAKLGGELPSIVYNTWITCLTPVSIEGDKITLCVRSGLQKEIVTTRYMEQIKSAISDVTGFSLDIDIVVDGEQPVMESSEPSVETKSTDVDYTFENYIVGPSNRFAHAACFAVSCHPAESYNPLFIYGGSGLGKTHLLYAIRHEVLKRFPKFKVVYLKGDDFTNELILAIKQGRQAEFRNKYRYADVFLIDDIQFISRTDATQEEFFHTFNALHENKKQIVLTSDRPPREMHILEERLRTRFEWGLLADVKPPEFETRIAIINNKADSLGIAMPQSVAHYIAERLKSNIRQLEGAVKKIKAFNLLAGTPINIESAGNAIKDILNERQPLPVRINRVLSETAKFCDISVDDIKSNKRTAQIAMARQISMYILRESTELSLEAIGEIFGGKNHTTVMYAISKVESSIESDAFIRDSVSDIIKAIKDE